MQFTTKVPIPKSSNPINYNSRIVAMGSCFAENMGGKFDYFRFNNVVNPFGIIFNPVSIEKIIARTVKRQEFTERDIFLHNGRWHSYEVHSDLSCEDKALFLENLNSLLQSANKQITEATHIIITYGSSWVYRFKPDGQIVANCHKVPQSEFDKQLLPAGIIEQSIQNTIGLIRGINPNCSFIFTVSPVRHIKDGFVENNVGKAHLLSALYNTISLPFSADNQQPATISYFSSYEIMMDELRDYRFYAGDMLHPGESAINYIWEQFFLSQMDESVIPIMEEVCAIQKSLKHKAFHPNSASHLKFLENLNARMAALTKKFPQIQF